MSNLNCNTCTFLIDPSAPPAPVIQASASSVSVGSNLQVTCIVVGEQDVVVEFTWEYPGQQVIYSTVTQTARLISLLHTKPAMKLTLNPILISLVVNVPYKYILMTSEVRLTRLTFNPTAKTKSVKMPAFFLWQIGRPLYTQDSVEAANNIGRLRQRSLSIIMVDEVRDVDQGTYTCTAQNLEGSRSASTTVKVVPKVNAKPRKP